MFRIGFVLGVIACFLTSNASVTNGAEDLLIGKNVVFDTISNNIDVFNKKSEDGTKEETFFSKATSYYNIMSWDDDKIAGTMVVFDNNNGYITISNDYYLVDYDYNQGFELIGENKNSRNIYYLAHMYSFSKELLIKAVEAHGSSIYDEFYWHGDYDWASEKTRYLLNEYDSFYTTQVNTSIAYYKNKTTWSTTQGSNNYCGAFALANLLWTYKYNQVLDITGGATTSYALAWTIKEVVGDTASTSDMLNVNSLPFIASTGYYIDYWTDLVNPLDTAPVVTLYNQGLPGHYALVTGKGESLYGTFLWMNIYTNWDITNTWHDRFSYNGNYLACKYWVDHLRSTMGFVLKNSSGNVVAL